MHTVMRDTVCTSVKSPSSFLDIAWFIGNNNSNSSWTSIKNDAFNDFFTPRSGAGQQDNVAMPKAVNWQP
jgi:hypothetical protein